MKRLSVYAVILIIVIAAIIYAVYSFRETKLTEYVESASAQNIDNLNATTNAYKKVFSSYYNTKLNVPQVKYYLDSAYNDPDNAASYRQLLRQYAEPVFQNLKNMNLKDLKFFFPNSENFLRINLSSKYGDDVGDSRKTVITANEQHKFSEGFERGKYYSGYRFVFPMFTQGRYVGSVEFMVSIEGLVDAMNDLYGNCYKYIVTDASAGFGSRPLVKLANNIYQGTCGACSVNANLENSSAVDEIIKRDMNSVIKKKFDGFESFSYIAGYEGKDYVISFSPIKLTDGRGIGYIISYRNDLAVDKIDKYYYMLTVVLIVLAVAVLALIAVLDNMRRAAAENSHKLEKMVDDKIKEIRERDLFFAQQGKMVSLGEMLNGILHQWKQPVSSISMLADMVEFECSKNKCFNEESRRLIAEIKGQTNFMTQTVNDFREFLRPSEKPVYFNVCRAIDELISMFEFSFAKHNTSFSIVHNGTACQLANIYGYPNEFKHVMLNLFNNARDAISETRDKMIADNMDVSKFKGEINIDVSVDGDRITVRVADTGGGIPQAVIDRIFDQYFSTKKEKGTGIGLYITKSLVENNMNGTISVHNTDRGAEFVLEFEAIKQEV